jgi:hypothetical protein
MPETRSWQGRGTRNAAGACCEQAQKATYRWWRYAVGLQMDGPPLAQQEIDAPPGREAVPVPAVTPA